MGELITAVGLGIGATITPCILPLYPAFLAYMTGSGGTVTAGGAMAVTRRLPPIAAAALVWGGVVSGMVAIGALLALLSTSFNSVNRYVVPAADGLLIVLGVLLLIGVNPFARLPQLTPRAVGRGGPAIGAYAYGLLFAPIALPCSGPFLVGIFAFSFTIGDVVDQLVFFLFFGIGFGLPLFVLGAIGQVRGAQVARFLVRWERPLQLVVGAALVVIGVLDLREQLPNIIG